MPIRVQMHTLLKENISMNLKTLNQIDQIYMEPNYELTSKHGHFPSPKVIEKIFKTKIHD